MKFTFGFLVGVLTGMFCILGPFVAFIGGVAVGRTIFDDDSEETPSKPTYPTYDGPDKVEYHGMSAREEAPKP